MLAMLAKFRPLQVFERGGPLPYASSDRYVAVDVHVCGAGAAGDGFRDQAAQGRPGDGRAALQPAGRRAGPGRRGGDRAQGGRRSEVGQGAMLKLEGLVALPWTMGDRSGVSFRANRIESIGVARRELGSAGRRRPRPDRRSVGGSRRADVGSADEGRGAGAASLGGGAGTARRCCMTWWSGCGAGGSSSLALWSWSPPGVCWRAAWATCRRAVVVVALAAGVLVEPRSRRWLLEGLRPGAGAAGVGPRAWSTRAWRRVRAGRPGVVSVARCAARRAAAVRVHRGSVGRASWRRGASSWPRACGCARSACCATAGDGALASVVLVAARPVRGRAGAAVARRPTRRQLSLWEPIAGRRR